jgi:hypothetical protein
MTDVGTLAWARRNGRRVSLRDRLTLIRLGVGSRLLALPDWMSYRLGLQRSFPSSIDLESLSP